MNYKLNQCRLRLAPDIESRQLQDGTRLLKQLHRADYIALDPNERHIMDRFSGERTVQEILYDLLTEQQCPSIRRFYVLVLHALDHGFLENVDDPADPSPAPELVSGRRWPVGWGLKTALVSFLAFVPLGVWSLVEFAPVIPRTGAECLTVLLMVILTLSVANLLEGFVLSGFGREVYRPRIRWDLGVPFFSVDTRDAFLGGRGCQASVAMQALSVPFLVATLACISQSQSALLAACFSGLALMSPFGDTPAHNLLHAMLRKAYHLPRCATTFLSKRLFRHLFTPSSRLKEDNYLVFYSFYAIVWLGLVILLGQVLLHDQSGLLAHKIVFPKDAWAWPVATLVTVVLAALLVGPLLCQVWLFGSNAYALIAPYWFPTERRVAAPGRQADASPSVDTVAKFLSDTVLFGGLTPEALSKIAQTMRFVTVDKHTVVIREGDRGDTLFVIYSGETEVAREDEAGEPRIVAKLQTGDVFGEIALLDKVPRTATVRSIGPVSLLVLDRSEFERVLVEPLGAEKVRTIIQVCNFLRNNKMFSEWPDRELLALAGDFAFVAPQKDAVIIEEGKPNSWFYLVYEGECSVTVQGTPRAVLRPGEFFGEISLLKGTPSVARVTAGERTCRCLKLGKERFLRFITEDVLTGVIIESTMESRMDRSRKR
ncbi:MAG: hypothetical protein A3K19_01050 [Lentisphaerae bacterium RIFOXYB12_FULL_65_16]|nr:MAG: hypothetical protein A3K18_04945 [Lentisphaerae bacterium RIFOXYA12_64_32]OGV93740.1 MAG: hypothetical protein A3K19_01050 [Lentisphaerae bacterium RIFOXYB12_FULL_65_16]